MRTRMIQISDAYPLQLRSIEIISLKLRGRYPEAANSRASSWIRLARWSGRRANTSTSQACESMSLSLAVAMRV
jgi:hypothetical protein